MCLVLQWLPTSLPLWATKQSVRWELPFPCSQNLCEVPLHGRCRATTIFPNSTSNILLMGYTVLIILRQNQCFGGCWSRAEVSRWSSAGRNLAVPSLRNTQASDWEPKLHLAQGSLRSITTLSLPLLKKAKESKIWRFWVPYGLPFSSLIHSVLWNQVLLFWGACKSATGELVVLGNRLQSQHASKWTRNIWRLNWIVGQKEKPLALCFKAAREDSVSWGR